MPPSSEWIYIDRHDHCPTEIVHVMAFIHRLRSLWLVPGDLHLTVPGACPTNVQIVPFVLHPKFGLSMKTQSVSLARTSTSDTLDGLWSKVGFPESLTRTVSSSIAHIFVNIPGCKLERNPQVSKLRPLDFALTPCLFPEPNIEHYGLPTLSPTPPFIMMGMKGPAYWKEKAGVWSTGHSLISLRMDLANHAHSQLSGLVARLEESVSDLEMTSLPEWLVLFGIIHDTEQMHIVAHIPIRKKHTGLCYVSYLLDDLPLGASTSPEERTGCEMTEAVAKLVLTALRRHAGYMTRSLYGSGTFGASNTMSNVKPASISGRSHFLDDGNASSSEYSGCSWNGSGERGYMKPSISSLYREGPASDKSPDPLYHLRRLDDKRRAAIVAWAKEVVPTQPSEEDTYRIAVLL
ncbi:hypothetical protein SCLCIDRAFT_11088 [Scleroderma citrinum Foug A]|uniref:Uncharacterized protein n=1 Tax=Scleroderma citrinum Foug A TaxID=1036808 RepID=A0A0C2YZM2_9AGAM|nr:hypothetical protein SCLCIDRAFT_11088 [Scleroderma citrinum Foug A]